MGDQVIFNSTAGAEYHSAKALCQRMAVDAVSDPAR
jgi:hypothetical protein